MAGLVRVPIAAGLVRVLVAAGLVRVVVGAGFSRPNTSCYAPAMQMRRTFVALAFAVALASGTTLLAQGFNVRTGTWEFTTVMQMSGPMPGVSPEVQQQIQAALAKPQTSRSCVTADDLASLNLGNVDDDEECKTVSSKITPTAGDIVRQCTGDDPRTETAHFETSGPTSVAARINAKAQSGAASNISMTGRWISAQCTE